MDASLNPNANAIGLRGQMTTEEIKFWDTVGYPLSDTSVPTFLINLRISDTIVMQEYD